MHLFLFSIVMFGDSQKTHEVLRTLNSAFINTVKCQLSNHETNMIQCIHKLLPNYAAISGH